MDRLQVLSNKIIDRKDIDRKINSWRILQDKIVFTNGVFDIIHRGHISYLARAASLGNRLVLGLNSDNSVKTLGKGDSRPINGEESRAIVLSAMQFIDAIVIFNESTPLNLIELVKPDVLVKGGDYNPGQNDEKAKDYIVGSDFVKGYGGEVIALSFVEGFSTTGILKTLEE